MGENLLAHIEGNTDSIMGAILTILAQLEKSVVVDRIERIDVYRIVKS